MFETFMQGRQAIDRAHGGLGLGLTIVKSLELHGGSEQAFSDGQGKGSDYGQRSDRERTRAAGFQAHVVKPVDFQHLTALLDRLLAAAPTR